MKKLLIAFALALASACAVWDYNAALQSCVASHVGDPVGREQCMCDVSKDAGRSCDYLDASVDGGAE
jgi:hypothetical protein